MSLALVVGDAAFLRALAEFLDTGRLVGGMFTSREVPAERLRRLADALPVDALVPYKPARYDGCGGGNLD